MANEEQVKRLLQGVREWNKWRDTERTAVVVDLRDVILRVVNLSRADLRNAILEGANLFSADLSDADLHMANLRNTNLSGANLRGANLHGANLSDAVLEFADLIGTDLRGANLSGAKLMGATFRNANMITARLAETVFGDVDLTGVTGLEQCTYVLPSTVDHRTLQKSWPLPLAFLRGVGLPDNLIEYLPSLLNQAIQHYSCFISYSSKDDEFAHRIHADLQNSGVRCWFAPHDMPTGDKILDALDAAIRLRDKVVLILSEHSIKSNWVEDEVTAGFEEERKRDQIVLFPVRLDEAVMNTNEAWAAKLRGRNIGDFRRWKDHDAYKQSLARVLRDLTKPQAQ
jgi:TIR domain/Pentapeptide repeats (8 copies)